MNRQYRRIINDPDQCSLCHGSLSREYIQILSGPETVINYHICKSCESWIIDLGNLLRIDNTGTMLHPGTVNMWNLFHSLWTKAVGETNYNKEDWMKMEKIISDLASRAT
jgi:hypothetical protein